MFKCSKVFISLMLVLSYFVSNSQTENKTYYKNGNIKSLASRKKTDTLQILTWHKNGQLKDSLWLCLGNNEEIPFGTAKKYFENGRLASKTVYGKSDQMYLNLEYYKNGQLERFVQRPTGLTKFYNKKGEQTREYDYNQLVDVYVPARYRHGNHLTGLGFSSRIRFNELKLANGSKLASIKSGVLVSLKFKNDTTLQTQCLIEGFSKDSVYISHFHYNPRYGLMGDRDVLAYEGTKVYALAQIKELNYTRHKNTRRQIGAIVNLILGYDVLFIPLATLPLTLRSVGDGSSNIQTVGLAYAGMVAVGLPLVYWGKYLYKSTVPKKYDFSQWMVVPYAME